MAEWYANEIGSDVGFKPYYNWNTFNTAIEYQKQMNIKLF